MRSLLLLVAAASLAATAPLLLPHAWDAARLVSLRDDPAGLAGRRLSTLDAEAYAARIEQALAEEDADLARSLAVLAADRGATIAPPLESRIAAAEEEERDGRPLQALNGFLSGTAETGSALAGSIAADLTGFGDVRDLYNQASISLAGGEVDTTTVAIAAVGLGITAATVSSLGAAMPVRAGASTLKAAHRAGRLSAPLRRQLGRLAANAVDTRALADLGRAAGALSPAAMARAARAVVRPAQAGALRALAGDVATIGGKAGYRGTLQALAVADSAADVGRIAKVAGRFGRATRGVLAMAGAAALTLASTAVTVTGWVFAGVTWMLMAAWVAARVVRIVLGSVFRLSRVATNVVLRFAANRPHHPAAIA